MTLMLKNDIMYIDIGKRITDLALTVYVKSLLYPSRTVNYGVLYNRINELRKLGSIKFLHIRGNPIILGKGHSSIVVMVRKDGLDLALKIRRIDSNKPDFYEEVRYMKLANSINVGPKLYNYSSNFILMEYIRGISIGKFLRINQLDKNKVGRIIYQILLQGFQLDSINLIHLQLSNADKHIIIKEKKTFILDWGKATISSSRSNVSQLISFFFTSKKPWTNMLLKIFEIKDIKGVLNAVRRYKKKRDKSTFTQLINVLNLDNYGAAGI